MPERQEIETSESSRRQLQGLPVIRRKVAGIDLGSERHWVCTPTLDGSGREIANFGATTAELMGMAEWLKARHVESVVTTAIPDGRRYWLVAEQKFVVGCRAGGAEGSTFARPPLWRNYRMSAFDTLFVENKKPRAFLGFFLRACHSS